MERDSGSTIGLGNANGGVLNFNKNIILGICEWNRGDYIEQKKTEKEEKW